MSAMDASAQRRWMEQWRAAAPALDEQRRRELRSLTSDAALAAADALLSVVPPGEIGPDRRTQSGLVEQQRLLHQRAPG
jgi:hypothetical protein